MKPYSWGLLMGTKFSVNKHFGIERVLILVVLSMIILTFGKGSTGETIVFVAVTQLPLIVLNFGEA